MAERVLDYFEMKIEKEAWQIGEAFLQGILLEVSSCPKPGLVSTISMGSHRDMNILTFMVGSAVISSTFTLCAQAGRNHTGKANELLPILRKIGIVSEKRLLEATKGVNTQRGILFAGGILCGAAGFLSKKGDINLKELFKLTTRITEGLVERELLGLSLDKKKLTAGEQLFLKYKATGIRGEVERGFPSVQNYGLPAFKEAVENRVSLNHCLVHTLISLMTAVEDTTILWRKDKETLINVQKTAQNLLDKGSVFTKEGLREIENVNKDFIKKNISPGGSADLVAVTVGSYLLENGHFPVRIL